MGNVTVLEDIICNWDAFTKKWKEGRICFSKKRKYATLIKKLLSSQNLSVNYKFQLFSLISLSVLL